MFSLGKWTPQLHTVLACTVLLRYRTRVPRISLTGLSPSLADFPTSFCYSQAFFTSRPALQPHLCSTTDGLGFSHFARHYFGNILFSSGYLDVSVPLVPSFTLFALPGFPIRTSRDRRSFTAPPGFSQCPTSFFGTQRQGILRKLFVAFHVM